jgi:hypothetical protein
MRLCDCAPIMTRLQIALAIILASIAITGACDYTAPKATNNSGGNGQGASGGESASASSSGQAGMGMGGNNSGSSSSGQGGTGNKGGGTNSGGGGGAGNQGGGSNSGGSGGKSSQSTVHCAPDQCELPDVCCIKPGSPPTRMCATSGTCSNIPVTCDGPEDCPGGYVCCGTFNTNEDLYISVGCDVKCTVPDRVICHPELGNMNCEVDQTCIMDPFLGPGYGYCQ